MPITPTVTRSGELGRRARTALAWIWNTASASRRRRRRSSSLRRCAPGSLAVQREGVAAPALAERIAGDAAAVLYP